MGQPYDPHRANWDKSMVPPFERQHQALVIHKAHHFDMAMWLAQREKTEKKAVDYNICRDAAEETLAGLALIERALGNEHTREWFNKGVAYARQVLQQKEGAA